MSELEAKRKAALELWDVARAYREIIADLSAANKQIADAKGRMRDVKDRFATLLGVVAPGETTVTFGDLVITVDEETGGITKAETAVDACRIWSQAYSAQRAEEAASAVPDEQQAVA